MVATGKRFINGRRVKGLSSSAMNAVLDVAQVVDRGQSLQAPASQAVIDRALEIQVVWQSPGEVRIGDVVALTNPLRTPADDPSIYFGKETLYAGLADQGTTRAWAVARTHCPGPGRLFWVALSGHVWSRIELSDQTNLITRAAPSEGSGWLSLEPALWGPMRVLYTEPDPESGATHKCLVHLGESSEPTADGVTLEDIEPGTTGRVRIDNVGSVSGYEVVASHYRMLGIPEKKISQDKQVRVQFWDHLRLNADIETPWVIVAAECED